ncbi:MAG: SDR family NAD(P)-dependent oxidoreductase, partial [Rhodothermales bacterium]
STITGKPLASNEDLAALLREQVTSPVRFTEAIRAAQELDLWIEVGPGRILTRLVSGFTQTPVMATDAAGPSLNGLLQAVGAAYVLGAPVRADALFEERFARPFDLNWQPQFFVNPCELAPASDPATNAPRPTIESIPVGANGTAPPLPSWMQDATVADQQSILDSIRHLVAERAELPTDAVRGEDRLLSDLHLNSITVSELLIELAGQLNLSPSVIPTNYADETLAEVAESFEDCILAGSPGRTEEKASQLPGLDAWIRPFTVALVEQERPHARRSTPPGTWRIFAPSGYPLKTALLEAFEGNAAGSGVIVALPPTPDEEHIPLLLDGVRTAISEERPDHFVLVQHGGGAASLARTLHLEVPGVTVCVVDIPIDHPDAVAWVLAEVQATTGYTEAHFDAAGTRREPRLRLLPSDERPGSLPIGRDDVLLVTGGGKGITAECALEIGRETNARLILLGRSQPPENAELAAVLKRMDDAGIRFRYVATDLTDAAAVRAVIKEVETQYGPVTGILHGAARNVPRRLRSLDETDFQETLAPKVQGLRHVLAAVDPEHLRLLVTFGSIIARMGLPSEADYALANEWLVRLTEDWQREHPHCQCLAIEWSVWSDVGMGARLGSLDALTAQGVIPIPPEKGIALLRDLLSRSLPDTAVVVTGRFGNPPTLKIEQPELPFLRFLEQPRIYYPGVELVAEAHLSIDTDPYLDDHVLQGERLLPAVIGLEAMAQAAMGLTGEARIPTFEDVSFNRPIVVPNDEGITLRVTALVRAPGKVDVALRCESTAFQVDHFRATCCFNTTRSPERSNHEIEHHTEPVSLDPEHALYDGILFQSGRFKRLGGYRMLRAKACLAELTQDTSTAWFGRYLPPDLVLGDPGARDAAIHAIQACIPHATLIPVAVDQVIFEEEQPSGRQFVHARERMREGTTFVYDMERLDADGRVLERWEGLRMQRVGHEVQSHSWAAPLLGPYMERRIQEWMPESDATLVVTQQAIKESTPSDQAIRLALGFASPGLWQRNGEQGNKEEPRVFVSQSNSLMLAAQGSGLLGCAMDPVRTRPETPWPDRLGPALYKLALRISERSGEDAETAVTRVWAARECLKKAGVWSETEPLTLDAFRDADWVFFIGRDVTVLSYHTTIQGCSETMVLTLLVRSSLRSPLAQKATEREGTPRDPGSNGSSN